MNKPQTKRLLAAALCALCAAPAWASDYTTPPPVVSTFSLVSNYVFRGLTRTGGYSAVQGGIEATADNGFYIGTWGSNVSWQSDTGKTMGNSLELDAYLGVKNSFATDFSYDFGVLRYHYPGVYNAGAVNADTTEVHAGMGYQWLALKYSYSLGNAFGISGSHGSTYTELSANIPVSDSGFTFGGHFGRQSFRGATAGSLTAAGMDPSYNDYRVFGSYNLNGYVLGFALTGTNIKGNYYMDVMGNNMGRSAKIFFVNHTF